jgi:predicted nuclease of predicted toxin-antitoxin system
MTLPALYLDEDAQSNALVQALRARGLVVATTSEALNAQCTDEEQLQFATSQNSVLVTCNVADFRRLHEELLATPGREHAGILLIRQQRWGPGELARRLIKALAAAAATGGMRNRLEFISNI